LSQELHSKESLKFSRLATKEERRLNREEGKNCELSKQQEIYSNKLQNIFV
jgi:hypothetical protein